MTITLNALQKQRRDTASNWTSNNPTLLDGELGYETDTKKFKIGDGSTAWQSLDYLPIPDTNRLLAGNLTVGGNFTVNGTTTTIDTTTLTVEDKNIEIGKVSSPSDTTADGGGITLKASSDRTITWSNANDSWDFNQNINAASTYAYKINNVSVLNATTLGSSVVNSSLTSVGTIATGVWNATAISGTKVTPDFGSQNITTTGTITTSTVVGSGDLLIRPAAGNNSIIMQSNNGSETLFKATVNGSVELYHGTSTSEKKFETLATGWGVPNTIEWHSGQNSLDFYDSKKASFGSSRDLQVFHDSNNSKIVHDGQGGLYIGADTFCLQNSATNENYICMTNNGAVELYHGMGGSAAEKKFETTSSGATVTGSLGIGTSTPTSPDGSNADNPLNGTVLTVYGDSPAINLTSSTTGSDDYSLINFGRTGSSSNPYRAVIGYKQSDDILRINASNHIAFDAGGDINASEKMRIDGSGNILIGGTSLNNSSVSGQALQIKGTDRPTIILRGNASGNNTGEIQFADNSGSDDSNTGVRAGLIQYDHGSNFMAFRTQAVERMRIDGSGNVGIGSRTTSPDNLLHVHTASNDAVVHIEGAADGKVRLRAHSGQSIVQFADSASSNVGEIVYDHGSDYLKLQVNASERMRIDSSGSVLIGATSYGGGGISPDLYISSTSGRQVKIHNTNSSTSSLQLTNAATGQGNDNGLQIAVLSDQTAYINQVESAPIQIDVNGSERMRITSDGKIGIGDSTPSVTLETVGHNQVTFGSMPETIISYGTTSAYDSGSAGGGINLGGRYNATENTLFGGIHGVKENTTINNYAGALVFSTRQNGGNSAERMRIDSNGNAFFGQMTSLIAASSNKGVNIETKSDYGRINLHGKTGAGTIPGIGFYHSGSGVGYINCTSSSVAYTSTSDYRLKENVVAISDGITRLKTLKPYRFNFKADASTTVDGFFAHEVLPVVPEAISGTKDEVDSDNNPVYQGIDQSKLVPLLVAAVQELIGKVEALEAA